MIRVTLEVYEPDICERDRFVTEFKDREEYNTYLSMQRGNPFLEVTVLNIEEISY